MGVAFSIFPLMFGVVFCFVMGMFVFVFVNMIRQKHRNDNSPRLTVPATVVGKRDHRSRSGDHYHTSYYVTFQFESGDRMELMVPGTEFGLLCEGDRGALSFQGTRYLSFQREF